MSVPLSVRYTPLRAQACTDMAIQAGPGEFGFYPLLDRSGGGSEAAVRVTATVPLVYVPSAFRVEMRPWKCASMSRTTASKWL